MPAKKKASTKSAATKKTARKTAPKKKTPVKKAVSKTSAVVKKSATGKAAVKKSAPKKATSGKGSASKKKASKKAPTSSKKAGGEKGSAASKKAAGKKEAQEVKPNPAAAEVSRRVTEALRGKVGSRKADDEEFRKGQPVAFSMEDVRDYLKKRKTAPKEPETAPKKVATTPSSNGYKPESAPAATPSRPKQSFGAASVADLLGFDPTADGGVDTASKKTEEGIPKKWITYFRALVALHEEVYEGLHRHSEETLRRSNKEDSGDLSSYGQHMADAGTDSFDRDFALSMVSSEQEALYEIDEAIRRIREGTYGVCEITGKPISRDRLRAVPFTRYSVEGQMEVERGKKRTVQKAGIQGFDGEDSPVLSDEDSDD